MSVAISNDSFKAVINPVGAELSSLIETATNIEYIWRGDPNWWNGSAPILFPIIGGLKDGYFIFSGKEYSLPNHGLARRKNFSLKRNTPDSATFLLKSDDSTKQQFPFDFNLAVHFKLEINGIAVQYDVLNTGKKELYFSIGSHPAFNLPFAGGYLENYYIHFGEEENMERYFFNNGLFVNKTAPVFNNCRQIYLTRSLFDDGVIILKNPKSNDFFIKNSINSKTIHLSTEPVPYLGLWSKPGGAPFVCLEPWYGLPDLENSDHDFTRKKGIRILQPDDLFSTTYRIEISGSL